MAYILNRKILTEISGNLSENNKKIVLTHGAFDLLHIGHTEFLKESKKLGDCLIVGLESDERIAKYKKKGRPVMPLDQRLEVMSSLDYVDFVFPICDDIETLNQKFYFGLYDDMHPTSITTGKRFKYKRQYKKYINKITEFSDINYVQITHAYDNLQSTSKLIQKIRRTAK